MLKVSTSKAAKSIQDLKPLDTLIFKSSHNMQTTLDTDPSTVKEQSNTPITSQESPNLTQSITPPYQSDSKTLRNSVSSQSSISSSSQTSSTNTGFDTIELSPTDTNQSPSLAADLIHKANTLIESKSNTDDETKALIKDLVSYLVKARSEANQFKIKAELLSISSKDADMRYEVENELIKREVDRLKDQGGNVEYLTRKLSHQKQTLKKYKNEIINKNKEIIQLRSTLGSSKTRNNSSNSTLFNGSVKNKHNSGSKRRRKSTESTNGMLDTLGLLASQVLTEEEKINYERISQSSPK